jgi:hypothetical protein
MAEHVAKSGGGSFHWNTGRPVGGKGYMVAVEGGEHTTDGPVTAADIEAHKETHQDLAESVNPAVHGVWGQTLDVVTKVPSIKKAKSMGVGERQESVWALPKTNLGAGAESPGPYGTEVLMHTGDLGEGDPNPEFRPGKRKFSKNEYDNPEWERQAGRKPARNKKGEIVTDKNGKVVTESVSYGDVLRTINRGRTERLRKGAK